MKAKIRDCFVVLLLAMTPWDVRAVGGSVERPENFSERHYSSPFDCPFASHGMLNLQEQN